MARSIFSQPHFHNEAAAFAYVEARLWPNGPVCHHCGERERLGKLAGKSTRHGLYKCYRCKKQFTVRMGSIFESSHLPLRLWLQVIHMMCAGKKGVSTNEVQRTLQCSMKTAWFLTHRIREMMNDKPGVFFSPIGGEGKTVEADETYIGPEAKNRAYEAPKPKLSVMSLVERGGAVRSFHVPNVTAKLLHPIIAKHAHRDSRFMTDEFPTYTGIGWNFAAHRTVMHTAKEYVRRERRMVDDETFIEEKVHTNTIEGYFSILKRGIYGVYQHVSEAHLHRYLNEFDFRYSYRIKTGFDDMKRAELALVGAKGKRLTYKAACS